MMDSEPEDVSDRPPQYSLRQLWIAVSICCLALHIGIMAAALLALIAVQAICFLLFQALLGPRDASATPPRQ